MERLFRCPLLQCIEDLSDRELEKMRDQLKQQGYMNEVLNFVDASHLVSKASLWDERDELIR